jgi:hypothetical protein
MSHKARLTVTIDPDLIEAGTAAVAAGVAGSLSAWVNRALAERVAKERRLRSLGAAIAAYESEFGVITPDELDAQQRVDRATARVVRGSRAPVRRHPRRRVRRR